MSFQPNSLGASPIPITLDSYTYQPSDFGFLAWTTTPLYATQVVAPSAGVAIYTRIKTPVRITIAQVWCVLAQANTSNDNLNTFFGIYDAGGTRRGVSADVSTTLRTTGSTGGIPITITADTNQSLTLSDAYCWVGYVAGTVGTTGAQFRSDAPSGGLPTFGVTAAPFICGTIGSGLTALPASITPSSMAGMAGPIIFGLK